MKINESFETLGAFWDPEQPEHRRAGTLSSRDGRLHFLTSPQFEVLDPDALGNALLQWGNPQKPVDVNGATCLQGRTEAGDCSILRLTELNSPGVLDLASGENLYAQRFRVSTAVFGLRLTGAMNDEIDSATFRFTDVHEWLPHGWVMEISDHETIYRLPRKGLDIFRFSSRDVEAEISCEFKAMGKNSRQRGTRITPILLLRVLPKTPKSFDWFMALLPRFENFFSLFLGTSVAPKQIGLFEGDNVGWVVEHQLRRRENPDLQLWVRCPPYVVAKGLASWLAVPEDSRGIEEYYWAHSERPPFS